MILLLGAQYERDGQRYRLLGVRSKAILFQPEDFGDAFEVSRAELDDFAETGVHDHDGFCCRVHNTHVSPHQGCILR